MKRSVLWDSSAILACMDRDDADHTAAVTIARSIAGQPAVITNYLQAETHAVILRRLGRHSARDWLQGAGFDVVRVSLAEEERARAIIAEYQDKDWSLCDAISFAVMDIRRPAAAFSFDRHFRQYGRFRVLGR
jgi:predicted nucleic acid-binding protein